MNRSKELSLKGLFNVFLRYKYIILFVTFISFVIAFCIAYYQPNIYQASTTVQIEKREKQTLKPNDLLGTVLDISTESNLNTEKEIIKSRFLVEKVINKLNINKEFMAIDKYGKKHYFYKNEPLNVDINSTNNVFLTIVPKTNRSFLLDAKIININGKYSSFSKNCIYNKTIKTPYFTITVKKEPNVKLDMEKYKVYYYMTTYLANNISNNKLYVENLGKDTSILKISYIDTVPKRAQEFVNSLTKIYMEQNLKNKTREVVFTLNFIEKQLNKIKKEMNISSKKLETFKKKSKTINIKESIKELSQKLAEYENQKNILNFKIGALKKIYNQVKKGNTLDTLTLAGTGLENKSVENLVSELQDALIKQKYLLNDYTYSHPEVVKISDKIKQLKVMIRKSVKNLLKNLEYKKEILKNKLSSLNKKLEKFSKEEQSFVNLERNFILNNKFYSYLLEKKAEAEIKKAATINRNRVLDLAVLPDKPIKPKRKTIYIIGLSFGFILGIIVAFLRYILSRNIETLDDIERGLNEEKIVGMIPKSKKVKINSYKNLKLSELEPSVVEEFRNLRTNIGLILDSKQDAKVLCVTSTILNEGKSFIAELLAQSISLLDKKVLLVDTNLKSLDKNGSYEVKKEKGLSNYLKGEEYIDNIIQNREGIDIIYSGDKVENASELISSKKMYELIESLKNTYDIIIIDTPPFIYSSEVKNIVKYSDLVLYILKMKFSHKEYLDIINKISKYKEVVIIANSVDEINNKYKYDFFEVS